MRARGLLAIAAVSAATGLAASGPRQVSAGAERDGPRGTPPQPIEEHSATAADLERLQGVIQASPEPGFDFYFTRVIYSGWRGYGRRGAWSTDFPKADRQFLFILQRLMKHLHLYEWENPVRLDDPELRRFPFIYALEVGYMDLTEPEVEGLRSYLEAGGFMVIDDFWGTWEWQNFEYQMSRVLPDRRIVDIPLDHPIFHQFYDIDEILQVPSINNARWGRTHERDGFVPHVRGIFDDEERLMVVINWNTDLGDAWEWSERPEYPIEYSNFAYELAVNFIIYGLTH